LALFSHPEFLREGAAINDFKLPDRIVIGADDARARDVMSAVYRPLYLNRAPLLFTDRRSSELIKYAANAFLATKISFINEMADLCEKVGANVQDLARGIGLDNRIGGKFLHAGPGYGGSCFPKDTLALLKTGEGNGVPLEIVAAVNAVNERRKRSMTERVIGLYGRIGRGQDRRRPRPYLQAEYRRHARGPVPRHHSGPAGGGRHRPRPRSARHGGSATAPSRRRLRREPL